MPAGNRPAEKISIGRMKATIWPQETQYGVRYSVSFQKIYKSGDEWKSTSSFSRDELLTLAKLADLAHTWVFEHEGGGREQNGSAGGNGGAVDYGA